MDYTPIDFAQVAQACGGSGYRVDGPAHLVPAVKRALGDPLLTVVSVSVAATPVLQPAPQ